MIETSSSRMLPGTETSSDSRNRLLSIRRGTTLTIAGALGLFLGIAALVGGAWLIGLHQSASSAFIGTGMVVMGSVLLARMRTSLLVIATSDRNRRRLQQSIQDRLNERTRIARDLHDSLLQGFHGLMFRLEAVRQLLPLHPGEAANSLEVVIQMGDRALREGREAVQDLRSTESEDRDLATRLGGLGAELGVGMPSHSKPQFRVLVEGQPRELVAPVRDDAYRITREAVRNAFEHAKANRIEVEITFGESNFLIRVRDDGIGMDAEILTRGQRLGHWGLPGMRERCDSVGGQLHIWSEGNSGTEVELRIPTLVAYAQRKVSPSAPPVGVPAWFP